VGRSDIWQEYFMGRLSTWMVCGAFWLGFTTVAPAQSRFEPRGRTFSQGGGWRHNPREHHVNVYVPNWYGGSNFGYGGFGFAGPGFGIAVGAPAWNYGGYPAGYGGIAYPGAYLPYPLPMSEMPNSPLTPPPDALPAQRSPWEDLPRPKNDPALRPVIPSSAAARLRGLEYQADGDQSLRQQLWQRAYVNYRQAFNVADDLAEAHLRYGIVLALLNRQDQAAREFRRAVHVDPSLPTSKFSLESLFGPDSRLVRSSFLSRITQWAEEDVRDPERLFVLGVLLHFDGDDRAQELFSAVVQMTDGAEHAVVFLPRVDENQPAEPIPPRPGDNAVLPPAPLPAAPLPDVAAPRNLPARTQPNSLRPQLNGPTNSPPRSVQPPSPKPPTPDGPVLLPPTAE